MPLQHLRSSTAHKRPVPGNMSDGQLGINTNTGSPGLFFKDSNNALVKVGPVHVGTTAPNASPASGGTAGNSVGEQWLDTTGGTYVFKVWDGSAWRSESGTFVDVNGDVMTGALGIIAGSAGSPGLYFSGDTNTGLYSPGADQVAISTGGSGRLFVDASGNVGVAAAPSAFGTRTAIQLNGSTSNWFAGGANGTTLFSRNIYNDGSNKFIGTGFASIYYQSTAGDHVWERSSASGTAGAAATMLEALRITSAGLVGVGTSSPGAKFQINVQDGFRFDVGANAYSYMQFGSAGAGEGTGEIGFERTTGNVYIKQGTNGSLSTAVTIDGNSRVGIGTTSPGAIFHSSKGGTLPTANGTETGIFQWNGVTGHTSSVAIVGGSAASSELYFGDGDDIDVGSIKYEHPNNALAFVTNTQERARIDSSGRLLVGLSSGTPSTTVFGTAIASVLTHSRDTSTGAVAQIYGSAGEFRIIGSGNAQNTNNSYGAISDQSLKTDISDAGSQWDDIKGITVRKFKLIGTDNLQIGVVAQECELVSPGLVEDTVLEQEDGTTSTVKAVKYSVLYMKAVKALQEAMERIEQLEQRLAAAGI